MAAQPAAHPRPSAFSNALGNLILLVILVCLVSIPFLFYFTDTASRLKREVHRTIQALEGNNNAGEAASSSEELKQAREKIALLEEELLATKAQAEKNRVVAQPIAEPQPPPDEPEPPQDVKPAPTVLPRQEYDVAKLFNGVGVRTTLDLRKGDTATKERITDEAYEFEIKLKINVPQANQSVAELAALNPQLPEILPSLGELLQTGKVSPFYDKLYSLKNDRIKSSMTRLDKLETRHNYFDCETVLQLTHPETERQALLIQGEMDVVADGSDGDRMPAIDDYISLSRYYQPTTSYGWAKKSKTPNPLIPRLEKELNDVLEEYKIVGLPRERNRYLENRRDELRRLIGDLKVRSYLIAEADPFIVLPLSMLRQVGKVSHAPSTGDYAVVIYGSKVYPVICGDAGPSWKFGESSLLMAQTINPKASPYSRPVSDLKVTYVVFPGSKEEKNAPPDLARWTARCEALLEEIGGLGDGFELHDWRDIIAERRAVREGNALKGQVAQHLATADGAVAEVGKAVSAAETKLKDAEAALTKAKEAAAAADALAPLEQAVTAATEAKTKAEAASKEAQVAAARVKAAAELVDGAVEKIAAATAKPLNEPKIDTTLAALKALEEGQQALDQATADAQLAREAVNGLN